MQRPKNIKIGDRFRVIEEDSDFDAGEIITLESDDGSDCPFFWKEDKSDVYCIYWSDLEPVTKTIRDARVGDVVVGNMSRYKYMVLERGQSTVTLSQGNNFKIAGDIYTIDELEKDFTLKAEPVVVSDKTAEAIKVLEEAGYNVEKKKGSNPVFSTMTNQISGGPGVSYGGSGGAGYGSCSRCLGALGLNGPLGVPMCRCGS